MPEVNASQPTYAGALKVAGLAGVAGIVIGGTAGILRSPNPVAWAATTTAQWAILGGSFWGLRTAFIRSYPARERGPSAYTYGSTLSGGATFALFAAMTRGRKSILPAAAMGSVIGYTGQQMFEFADDWRTESNEKPQEGNTAGRLINRLAGSSWSPVKVLSNDDYAERLRTRLLHVEAEIALLNEDIERLRKEQREKSGGENIEKKEG